MVDGDARRHAIDPQLQATAVKYYHPLLDACFAADPALVAEALARCHSGQPDGRFLVARALANPFLEYSGLVHLDPSVDDVTFGKLSDGYWTVLLAEAGSAAVRRALTRDFLLAVLRQRHDAQFHIIDEHEDHVLFGLAELLASWMDMNLAKGTRK